MKHFVSAATQNTAADRRPQTADRRPQTADRRRFILLTRCFSIAIIFAIAMIPSIVSAQNIFPVAGNVGIGSNLPPAIIPIKPLHIFNPPNWTDDPAIRLESGFIVGGQVGTLNNGHLALLTNTNLAFYTRCIQYSGYGISSASIGDMVLQTSDRGEDLILTTRNVNGRIRFATTPTDTDGPGGIIDDDYERMTITPSGKIGIQCPNPLGALDINLGTADWQYNLPKVSMIQGNNGYPQIRLYSPTGNTWNDRAQSTSWYIEQSNTYDYHPLIPGTYSALRFRAGINPSGGTVPYLNDIGSEVPITRMSLISNGNVGINQDKPIAKLQVTDGSILFDGGVGSTPKK